MGKSDTLAILLKILTFFVLFALFIITFPNIQLDYGTGLDASYIWALNHLFYQDYDQLLRIQYPFGPLTLLKQPTIEGNGIYFFLVFYTFVKILFLILFLKIARLAHLKTYILAFPLVFFVAFFASIDMLIIGLVSLFLLHAIQREKSHYFFVGAIFASLGLFIKSSIGIISFSMFPIAFYFFQRLVKGRLRLEIITGSLGVFFFIGILVFRDLGLIINYCQSILNLMQGYAALALFPNNNWWALGSFIGTIFLFPMISKTRTSKQAFYILLPALFFMWKHAMSREDHTHNAPFFGMLVLFWSIIFIFSERKKIILFLFPIISILSFYINMTSVPGFRQISIDYQGVNHFNRWITHTEKAKITEIKKISKLLESSKLDNEILSIIGHKTVDSYPWELSYFAVNNLIWQPRTTLQNGHFARWYDKTTAVQFTRETGPEFILFHSTHPTGQFIGIDNTYLLNDGPYTNFQLFDNYLPIAQRKDYILYQKSPDSQIKKQPLGTKKAVWNEWISTPIQSTAILRAKVKFKEKAILGVKQFLLKGQPYFIDLLTLDHRIFTYRFVAEKAQDGLWINPLIQESKSNHSAPFIQKIRFRTLDTNLVSNITIEWEQFSKRQPTPYGTVYALFGQKIRKDSVLLDTTLRQGPKIAPSPFLEERPAFHDEYAYTARINLDSFWRQGLDSVRINYQVIFDSADYPEAMLVISMDKRSGQWFGKKLLKRHQHGWNYMRFSHTFHADTTFSNDLTVMLWNPRKAAIQVNEARLIIDFKP